MNAAQQGYRTLAINGTWTDLHNGTTWMIGSVGSPLVLNGLNQAIIHFEKPASRHHTCVVLNRNKLTFTGHLQ